VKDIDASISYSSTNLDEQKKAELESVIAQLRSKTKSEYEIEKLSIPINQKKWVAKLLKVYPNLDAETAGFVIDDFNSRLLTRQKEEGKFTILICFGNMTILSHSKGEKTLTTTKRNLLKITKRLLDTGNVLRYLIFEVRNDKIYVSFYERVKSKSFLQFLGVPEGDIYYEFYGDIVFFLTFGNKILKYETSPEDVQELIKSKSISGNIMTINNTNFIISKIQSGIKTFESVDKFLEHFYTYLQKLDFYQDKFAEIQQCLDPFFGQIYDSKDEVYKIVNIKEGIKKETLCIKNHPFSLLFGYKKDGSGINFSEEFLSVLSQNMISGQQQELCHVGDVFCNIPIQILGLKIHNKTNANSDLLNIVKSLNKTYIDISGEKIKLLLSLGISEIARGMIFKDMHISYLFDRISEHILEQLNEKFNTNYNFIGMEEPVVEFKESTFWLREKNATEIANSLKEEIDKKLAQNPIVLTIIGMDEATNVITPISNSRLRSELINNVETHLSSYYSFSKLLKVPINESSSIILSITAI
jgi:hypothetical protein